MVILLVIWPYHPHFLRYLANFSFEAPQLNGTWCGILHFDQEKCKTFLDFSKCDKILAEQIYMTFCHSRWLQSIRLNKIFYIFLVKMRYTTSCPMKFGCPKRKIGQIPLKMWLVGPNNQKNDNRQYRVYYINLHKSISPGSISRFV